jgi:GT2 family glycosyltransferase
MSLTQSISTKPLVSILLLTYNSAEIVDRVLDSIESQSYDNIELCVHDNGSFDGTSSALRSRAIRFTEDGENVGYAAGMNLLLSRSNGELVVFLNADCVLRTDFIQNAVDLFESWSNIDVAGATVFKTGLDEGPLVPHELDGARIGVSIAMRVRLVKSSGELEKTFKVNGACPVYRRSSLDLLKSIYGVEGFDPIFDTYGEDIDLAFRCAGVSLGSFHCPELVAWHSRSNSSKQERITGKRGRLRQNVLTARHLNCVRHTRPSLLALAICATVAGDIALLLLQASKGDAAVFQDYGVVVSRVIRNCRSTLRFRRTHRTWRRYSLRDQLCGRRLVRRI